jgi:GMP synthase-like glutamine amidotransferase
MTRRRINILLCDTFPGRLPDFIPNYESLFMDLFAAVGEEPEYRIYQTWQGELPSVINTDELYVVPGSLDSAYDDKPWIVALLLWIEKAYCRGAKMMGVCFGHQAIARALGGEVRKYEGGFGAGVRASDVIDEQMKPYFPDGKMHLLYSHNDQVMTLPADAVRCATSDFCENESFRIGHQVVTFQGHPEFTVAYSRHLLLNCCEDVDEAVRRAALKSLDQLTPQGPEAARYALDLLFNP